MDATDAVLVVLVNRPRDLEIIHAEHWYRIPIKHAPPQFTHARYLAFYLTRAFGPDKWSIREYALVRGHELVRRRDLLPAEPDHPRAHEFYFKIELGAPLALPHPITSRTSRRILFLWTTGELFSRAVTIDELTDPREPADGLWNGSRIPFHRGVTT